LPRKSLSKKFKKDIADQRGDHRNFKIGSGEKISDGPSYTPLLPHARVFKLSHQEIRVEQEDDKAYLDHRSLETSAICLRSWDVVLYYSAGTN
jgi:hypothetical protein